MLKLLFRTKKYVLYPEGLVAASGTVLLIPPPSSLRRVCSLALSMLAAESVKNIFSGEIPFKAYT